MADPFDDPYRWLEDATDPRVTAWTLQREAEYEVAARDWAWRGAVTARLIELIDAAGTASTPRPVGGRLFVTHVPPGAEHPRLVVVEADGTVRTLLDPAAVDPSGATTLERWECSWDGALVAYQLASGGTEQSTLYVRDTRTGQLVGRPIDRVRRSTVAWLGDGSGFYYVRHAPGKPGDPPYHRKVYLHRLGADPDQDPLVFGRGGDPARFYAVHTSPDGRWLTISAAAGTAPRADVWIADLATSPAPDRPALRPMHTGRDARTGVLIPAGTGPEDRCYLLTDLSAPRGRLAVATPGDPDPARWRDLLPAEPDAVLEEVAVLDGPGLPRPVLVAVRTRHAVSEVSVHDAGDGTLLSRLPLPPNSTVGRLRAAPAGATEAWFTRDGFTDPPRVMRYDALTGTLSTWSMPGAERRALGTRGAAMVTRQLECRSADGTTVRVFVVARAERPDRPRPALLTGYGGFGQSMAPTYSPEAVAWVEAGGVYAVATVRGGGEEGEQWHRAGMRERKQNTFADFEAAADHLVAEGWTSHDRLGVWGGSNGGLLVGAAITRRPHRYAAAVLLAPLLDMLRYELSGMGRTWVDEYGSANDPEQAEWLRAYSPYHRVRAGTAYPATLFAVFDGDTRVDPAHSRKMFAAMRDATVGDRPLLYRLERGVGHGARAASRRAALLADLLAFFADRLHLFGSAGRTTGNPGHTSGKPRHPSFGVGVGHRSTRRRQETAMGNSDIRAHSAGGDEDDAPCGVQLVSGLKPSDDVQAHSAGGDDDDAPCGVQFVSGLKPNDDVQAHSAGTDDDEAPCGFQLVSG